MTELTELISLDNWRKIRAVMPGGLPVLKKDISVLYQIANLAVEQNPADVFAGVVPPPHELQIDPVSPAFEMWHDAEERN